jgi:hypothetical protein
MIVIPCTITDIFERKFKKHHRGVGPEAVFTAHSEGWYIQLNHMVSIYIGMEKPNFTIDQQVKLSIE